MSACRLLSGCGFERDAGDGGDRGQRFAAETESGDREQVVCCSELRSGVAVNHFTGGNLVCHLVGKNADTAHLGRVTKRARDQGAVDRDQSPRPSSLNKKSLVMCASCAQITRLSSILRTLRTRNSYVYYMYFTQVGDSGSAVRFPVAFAANKSKHDRHRNL